MKGATVRVVVTKFIFTVYDKTFDLCESLGLVPGNESGDGGAWAVQCPIQPMAVEGLKACFPLSESLPTGVSFTLVFFCLFPLHSLGKVRGWMTHN